MKTLICVNEQVVTDPNERIVYVANIAASSSVLITQISQNTKDNVQKQRFDRWIPETQAITDYPLCEVYGISTLEKFQNVIDNAKELCSDADIYYSLIDNKKTNTIKNVAAVAFTFVTDEEIWKIVR